MRIQQNIFRAVIVVFIASGLISLTGARSKKGPLERLGGEVDRAVEDAGDAVRDATDKVKEGAEDATDKVKETVDDLTNDSDETPASASERASGNDQ